MSTGDVGHLDDDGPPVRRRPRRRDDRLGRRERVPGARSRTCSPSTTRSREVAVIGVDDEKFGQRLKAFVVHQGRREAERGRASRTTCKANLARFKVPREVEFIDELPAQRHRQGPQARAERSVGREARRQVRERGGEQAPHPRCAAEREHGAVERARFARPWPPGPPRPRRRRGARAASTPPRASVRPSRATPSRRSGGSTRSTDVTAVRRTPSGPRMRTRPPSPAPSSGHDLDPAASAPRTAPVVAEVRQEVEHRLARCGHDRAGLDAPHGAGRGGTTTAAPRKRPARRSSSASLARSSGYSVTSVRTGTRGASARNSSPSPPGQVGHRPQHALLPQQPRRETTGCRSCGSRRTPRSPPRSRRPQRGRDQRADRARRSAPRRAARAPGRASRRPTRRPARARTPACPCRRRA